MVERRQSMCVMSAYVSGMVRGVCTTTPRPMLKKFLFLLLLGIIYIIPSVSFATGFGNSSLQRFTGTFSTTTSMFRAGGWCATSVGNVDTQRRISTPNDSGYYYFSTYRNNTGTPSVNFFTDHDSSCPTQYQNANYQVPVVLPTASDNYSLFVIMNDDTLNSPTVEWCNHIGTCTHQNASYDVSNVETFIYNGEPYVLWNTNTALVSAENEGYLKEIYIGNNTATMSTRIYAVIYTSADLIAEINTSNQMKDYLDALLAGQSSLGGGGFTFTVIPSVSNLQPVNASTTASTDVYLAFDYTSGQGLVDMYTTTLKDLTTGVTSSVVGALPADSYGTVSGTTELVSGHQYYYTVCLTPYASPICASTLFSVITNSNPFAGIVFGTTTSFTTLNVSSTTIAGLSYGVSTTTISAGCDLDFPYDASSAITATITYLPNSLCKLTGYLFGVPDQMLDSVNVVPASVLNTPPFSSVITLINSLGGLDYR